MGVMVPGLIFDFVGGASYLPFFYGAGIVGILAMVASLFATKPNWQKFEL